MAFDVNFNNRASRKVSFGTYQGEMQNDLVLIPAWNFSFRVMEPENRRGEMVYHELSGDRLRSMDKGKDNYGQCRCNTKIDTAHGDYFMLIDRATAVKLGAHKCSLCG